jgi:transcriptional regulator with XRE-family HTH domain
MGRRRDKFGGGHPGMPAEPMTSRCLDPAGTRFGVNLETREPIMARGTREPVDKYVGSRVRMRRLMLEMSQTKLGDALGVTFQQVQKYEKGVNRIGASRLQHIARVLQVPVAFFFEGAPAVQGPSARKGASPSPTYVSDFLATSEGLALTKAFMQLKQPVLRRCIVKLVQQIAGEAD